MLEKPAKKAFLSLGSNLGNKKKNIELAKYFLEMNKSIKILKVSNYYITESWPDKKKPFFFNIVVQISTTLLPVNLFIFIKNIEKLLGRTVAPKNSPRTCDIDIIDYNSEKINITYKNNHITIPHPRLHLRNFVLLPLYEISKTWFHPKFNKKIAILIKNLKTDNLRSIKIL